MACTVSKRLGRSGDQGCGTARGSVAWRGPCHWRGTKPLRDGCTQWLRVRKDLKDGAEPVYWRKSQPGPQFGPQFGPWCGRLDEGLRGDRLLPKALRQTALRQTALRQTARRQTARRQTARRLFEWLQATRAMPVGMTAFSVLCGGGRLNPVGNLRGWRFAAPPCFADFAARNGWLATRCREPGTRPPP